MYNFSKEDFKIELIPITKTENSTHYKIISIS